MKKLPAEIVASALAVTTIFIALLPYHLPPWAIFITWAGTFAAGGPTPAVLRKIWPAMFVGNFFAFVIVLCFRFAAQHLIGNALIAAECVILFTLNATMMSLGRLSVLSFIPGMFFGFASFFATYFGGFGPERRMHVVLPQRSRANRQAGPRWTSAPRHAITGQASAFTPR